MPANGAEIMPFDLARREHAHYPPDGWRQAPSGNTLAGHRRLGVTKGPSGMLMARRPHEPVSSRRECRQVIRIFLAGLGIGFALTGVAAWAIGTELSAGPILTAKTPTRSAEIVLAKNYFVEARVANDIPSARVEAVEDRDFDAKLFVALTSGLSAKDAVQRTELNLAERSTDAASAQPHPPLAPQTISVPVPTGPSHTAVYDIAGHIVYLPNGQTLEAHSGLGRKLDDPHYVKVKNRGPTPPNVYQLKLREKLFHKVRAIRLVPVDDGNMFGRDGMLAHSYMRGVSGQSNGCISFKDYPAFLRAYLNGEIDRLVVVTDINSVSWHSASAAFGSQILDTN